MQPTVGVPDQGIEVVEVPGTVEELDLVCRSPDIQHVLPGAMLGRGFDAEFHVVSRRAAVRLS
jgi:hypothetical protein